MQQTLIVTVKGPKYTLDIELPGYVPISDLLPLLLEMSADTVTFAQSKEQPVDAWALSVQGLGEPMQRAFTLFDSGVLDGDILLLQMGSLPPRLSQNTLRGIPETIVPNEHTGMIGVTWEREWLR